MIELLLRNTHKYVNGHSHLDEWETIGTADVLHRFTEAENPYGRNKNPRSGNEELSILVLEVVAYQNAPVTQVVRAIRDTFATDLCTHDFDGCGCTHTVVDEVYPHSHLSSRYTIALTTGRTE